MVELLHTISLSLYSLSLINCGFSYQYIGRSRKSSTCWGSIRFLMDESNEWMVGWMCEFNAWRVLKILEGEGYDLDLDSLEGIFQKLVSTKGITGNMVVVLKKKGDSQRRRMEQMVKDG